MAPSDTPTEPTNGEAAPTGPIDAGKHKVDDLLDSVEKAMDDLKAHVDAMPSSAKRVLLGGAVAVASAMILAGVGMVREKLDIPDNYGGDQD